MIMKHIWLVFMVLALPAFAGEVAVAPDPAVKLLYHGGDEFGTSGGAPEVVKEGESYAVKLSYNFGDGGVYTSAGFPVTLTEEFKELKFTAKTDGGCGIGLRIIDASGECFQFKFGVPKADKAEKYEADLKARNVECWGGDGNKTIDQPIKALHFVASKSPETKVEAGSALFYKISLR